MAIVIIIGVVELRNSGFRVPDSGFRVVELRDSGFRFPDSGFRIQVFRFRLLGLPPLAGFGG